MTSIGIVIPTLDEADRVPTLLDALGCQLEASDVVVVVDNGSTDGTLEILRNLSVDRPWLTVLDERRPGPGWARRAGASHIVGQLITDPGSTWILSCDADAEPSKNHLSMWRHHLAQSGADLVTGSYQFPDHEIAVITGAADIIQVFGRTARACEAYVGVVNPTGSNHAVRASSYPFTHGYQQPQSARFSRGSCVVAGDDWDLGVRTRLAGLMVERVDHRMVVSARRFLADPAGYLTGSSHDGPFGRVESQGIPSSLLDLPQLIQATAARAVLHFLLKPLLLGIGDLRLVLDLCGMLDPCLGEAVMATRGAGRRLWTEDRDSFIYDLLGSQAPLADAVAENLLVCPSFGTAAQSRRELNLRVMNRHLTADLTITVCPAPIASSGVTPLNQSTTTDRTCLHLPETFAAPDLVFAMADGAPVSGLDSEQLLATVESVNATLHHRLNAGAILGIIGDPRIRVSDPPMMAVPAQAFVMGLDPDAVDGVCTSWAHVGVAREWIEKEVPAHEVRVEAFRIGRFPVTTAEYRVFLEEVHRAAPRSWRLGAYPWWHSNHPVHGVTVNDARDYANWLSARTGRRFRLPTEAEWELAATGGDRRAFPWGDSFDPALTNTLEGGPLTTTPVGIYPDGAAPCGALDLAGNVEEWVDSTYAPYPGGRMVKDDLWNVNPEYTVTRGGSHARFGDLARCQRRHGFFPRDLYVVGFRLVEETT